MRSYELMALDAGNENIKVKSAEGEVCFRHAIRQLTESDKDVHLQAGELDNHPHIWKVNDVYYYVGEYALRKGAGAVLYGESRYVSTYYGVLAAVAADQVFDGSRNRIYLYGGHTPKDRIYRQDLVNAVVHRTVKSWHVEHLGVSKTFSFIEANGYDEPVGVYRYATMTEDGRGLRNEGLRSGECLIVDIGGFTTAFTVAQDGRIDYTSSVSKLFGVLDVLDEFGKLLRRNHRQKLKGMQELHPAALRKALITPQIGYDARGLGMISCVDEANQASEMFMRELDVLFQQFGGVGGFHAVLLGGGGSGLLEARIQKTFNHRRICPADSNLSEMHFVGVRGAFRTLRSLENAARL